jgi:hypothetical protein
MRRIGYILTAAIALAACRFSFNTALFDLQRDTFS